MKKSVDVSTLSLSSFLRILLHTSITGTMQFSEGFSDLELDQQITLKGKFLFFALQIYRLYCTLISLNYINEALIPE